MLATLRELGVEDTVVEKTGQGRLDLLLLASTYDSHVDGIDAIGALEEAVPSEGEGMEKDSEYAWSPQADVDTLTTMRKWRHEPRAHTHAEPPVDPSTNADADAAKPEQGPSDSPSPTGAKDLSEALDSAAHSPAPASPPAADSRSQQGAIDMINISHAAVLTESEVAPPAPVEVPSDASTPPSTPAAAPATASATASSEQPDSPPDTMVIGSPTSPPASAPVSTAIDLSRPKFQRLGGPETLVPPSSASRLSAARLQRANARKPGSISAAKPPKEEASLAEQ